MPLDRNLMQETLKEFRSTFAKAIEINSNTREPIKFIIDYRFYNQQEKLKQVQALVSYCQTFQGKGTISADTESCDPVTSYLTVNVSIDVETFFKTRDALKALDLDQACALPIPAAPMVEHVPVTASVDRGLWETTLDNFKNTFKRPRDYYCSCDKPTYSIYFGMYLIEEVKQVLALVRYFQDFQGKGTIILDPVSLTEHKDSLWSAARRTAYKLEFDKEGIDKISAALEALTIDQACALPLPEESTTPSFRF